MYFYAWMNFEINMETVDDEKMLYHASDISIYIYQNLNNVS